MELLKKITDFLDSLSHKEFKNYLIITVTAVGLIALGVTYQVYRKSNSITTYIKQLNDQVNKASEIIANNERIQHEEDRIQEIILKNKDFSIKSYFEKFCHDHNISPEPGWDTTTNRIEGNEKFDEITLPATFKNQSMKTLVTILDVLDKNEIVYIKELRLRKEGQRITCELTIATKKPRKVVEE